jgi:transcription elongation factor Elf1
MGEFPVNGAFSDSPEVGRDQATNRVHIEFYCQGCDHYTYVWLNLNLTGNHIMNCPNCGRKHYRAVKKGIITRDRYDKTLPDNHEIIAMKSACSKERRRMGSIARQREAEASGLMK